MRQRWLRRLKEIWGTKRGASTVEYVIVITAAVLLATALLLAVNNDGIKSAIDTKIRSALEGQVGQGGSAAPSSQPPSGNSSGSNGSTPDTAIRNSLEGQVGQGGSVGPSGEPPSGNRPGSNGSTPVSHSGNGSNVSSKAGSEVVPLSSAGNSSQNDKPWYVEFKDYVSENWFSGWDPPDKVWERTKEDLKKLRDHPGQYLSEALGLEEMKQTVNQVVTNPKQFVKDKYNQWKEDVKTVVEDPGGALVKLGKELDPITNLKVAWNGVDPETGEVLSIPERLARGVPAGGAVVKGTKIGKKILVWDKVKKGCACPHGNNSNSNNNNRNNNKNNRGFMKWEYLWDEECEVLAQKWHPGSFEGEEDAVKLTVLYHFDKHKDEVNAQTPAQYMRKAEAFSKNLRGARKQRVLGKTPGVIRYIKNGKYIDMKGDKIISFGKR